MLIALLAMLGVNLAVLVLVVLAVLGRRRWVSHQVGAFPGIARVVDGELHGLGSRPRRGYGRWVRDVLVWTPAPFFLRNALAPIDRVDPPRQTVGKVRRLGDHPLVIALASEGVRIEVTVRDRDGSRVAGPFDQTATSATIRPPEH